MNDRPIHVTLSMDEYIALKNLVSDKLKSCTDFDWDSGLPNDLDAANSALTAAWKRCMRPVEKRGGYQPQATGPKPSRPPAPTGPKPRRPA